MPRLPEPCAGCRHAGDGRLTGRAANTRVVTQASSGPYAALVGRLFRRQFRLLLRACTHSIGGPYTVIERSTCDPCPAGTPPQRTRRCASCSARAVGRACNGQCDRQRVAARRNQPSGCTPPEIDLDHSTWAPSAALATDVGDCRAVVVTRLESQQVIRTAVALKSRLSLADIPGHQAITVTSMSTAEATAPRRFRATAWRIQEQEYSQKWFNLCNASSAI